MKNELQSWPAYKEAFGLLIRYPLGIVAMIFQAFDATMIRAQLLFAAGMSIPFIDLITLATSSDLTGDPRPFSLAQFVATLIDLGFALALILMAIIVSPPFRNRRRL